MNAVRFILQYPPARFVLSATLVDRTEGAIGDSTDADHFKMKYPHTTAMTGSADVYPPEAGTLMNADDHDTEALPGRDRRVSACIGGCAGRSF